MKFRLEKAAWLWIILLASFVGLAFYLMKPGVVGFLYDDGMYLMAAKALATGEGYRLSGMVEQPYFYKYPPLYPLLLAGGWLLNSDFPQNIVWLKSLNITLSAITLGLWGYYFQNIRRFPMWISLMLVAIIGTNWRFLEVSIDLMSEPLFMALSALSLILCHRFSQTGSCLTAKQVIILTLVGVASFYTRTMALPLILATGLWLWIDGQRKQALGYGLGSLTLIAPWLLWSGSRKNSTYAIGDFLVRTFQETYFQSFRMDLRYEYTLPELVSKGVSELLGNLSVQFFPILERFFLSKPTILSESVILGLSFVLALVLGRYAYQKMKARQFSPEGLYLGIYLAVLPFWSFYSIYPRFLVVIFPFLLGFLATIWLNRFSNRRFITACACASILAINLTQLLPYLSKPNPNSLQTNRPDLRLWASYQGVLRFIRTSTPQNTVLYSDNLNENYFYALNTGRQTTDFFLILPPATLEKKCPESNRNCVLNLYGQNGDATYQALRQQRVTHVIAHQFQINKEPENSWRVSPKSVSTTSLMLTAHPQAFQPVHQSSDQQITVYRFQPNWIQSIKKDQ